MNHVVVVNGKTYLGFDKHSNVGGACGEYVLLYHILTPCSGIP